MQTSSMARRASSGISLVWTPRSASFSCIPAESRKHRTADSNAAFTSVSLRWLTFNSHRLGDPAEALRHLLKIELDHSVQQNRVAFAVGEIQQAAEAVRHSV